MAHAEIIPSDEPHALTPAARAMLRQVAGMLGEERFDLLPAAHGHPDARTESVYRRWVEDGVEDEGIMGTNNKEGDGGRRHS